MRRKLNTLILFLVVLFITVLSLVNLGSGSPATSFLSYVFHFAAYFVLAGALLLFFHETLYGHLEASVLATFTGLSIEFFQLVLPFRSFSVFDILLNMAGAFTIFLDYWFVFVTRIIRFEDRMIERVF